MPPGHTRAFWVVRPGEGLIRDEPLPPRGPSDVLVRTLFTGVSRGTETLVFTGAVPPSEYDRMRAPFQDGRFPAPVKYGYCSVGVVEEGPAALAGNTVFCLYPHQTRYVVPASAVAVVPPDVPAGRAVLAANLETAINGVWDAGIQPGDRVAVIGAGTVGSLVGYIAGRIPGCEVCLVDINRSRASIAAALGVAFAVPDEAPRDRDIVVNASGAAEGLQLALRLAGFEATVVELSWFGSRPVTLALGGEFHSQRLTIRSSQVGHVSPGHRPRWTHRRRLELAVRMLADTRLDALVTGESPFEMLPQLMPMLTADAAHVLCHRIRYEQDEKGPAASTPR